MIHNNNNNNLPEIYFTSLLTLEGGLSDDKDDRGGRTNYGLSSHLIKRIGQKYGISKVDDINIMKAYKIYDEEFWKKYQCYEYPEPLNFVVFDSFINHGPLGTKYRLKELLYRLQEHYSFIHLIDDENKVQNLDYEYLKNKIIMISRNLILPSIVSDILILVRMNFYHRFVKKHPSQKKFLGGWIRRLKIVMDKSTNYKG